MKAHYDSENMNQIFNAISARADTMRKDGWSWTSVEKAELMAMICFSIRAQSCCEIGVWGGGSLFPVATILKEMGGKRQVWAIDPWSPAASGEGYTGINQKWWTESADHEGAYRYFQKVLNETGTFQFVKVIRGKSDNVVPPEKLDFLHVDGQHTEQAVRDVDRFASKVRIGGFCVLDDLGTFDGHVDRAADRLRGLGFVELYRIGGGDVSVSGIYQKV